MTIAPDLRSSGETGIKNVYFCPGRTKPYRVQVCKRYKHVGYFTTRREAYDGLLLFLGREPGGNPPKAR